MWRKRNAPPLLVGLQACTTTLEISLAVPQKKWTKYVFFYAFEEYCDMQRLYHNGHIHSVSL
jgi:hypothetical protein